MLEQRDRIFYLPVLKVSARKLVLGHKSTMVFFFKRLLFNSYNVLKDLYSCPDLLVIKVSTGKLVLGRKSIMVFFFKRLFLNSYNMLKDLDSRPNLPVVEVSFRERVL